TTSARYGQTDSSRPGWASHVRADVSLCVSTDAQAAPGAREEREMMAYENQALWTILEYLNKALTPDQLLENAQLATNLAGFCSALVDQVELQAFPAGKYKVFKFVMKYLRHITAQPN